MLQNHPPGMGSEPEEEEDSTTLGRCWVRCSVERIAKLLHLLVLLCCAHG